MVYKCERCLIFDDPTQSEFNTSTSAGQFEQGWAQALSSAEVKTDANSAFGQHDNGQGEFQIVVKSATQTDYTKWAAMTATSVPTGTSPTATATSVPFSAVPVPTATSYDYVIIGGGAAGIPIADKLSETGKSVLLVEKGIASSARWGGSGFRLLALEKCILTSLPSSTTRKWMARWAKPYLVRYSWRV